MPAVSAGSKSLNLKCLPRSTQYAFASFPNCFIASYCRCKTWVRSLLRGRISRDGLRSLGGWVMQAADGQSIRSGNFVMVAGTRRSLKLFKNSAWFFKRHDVNGVGVGVHLNNKRHLLVFVTF